MAGLGVQPGVAGQRVQRLQHALRRDCRTIAADCDERQSGQIRHYVVADDARTQQLADSREQIFSHCRPAAVVSQLLHENFHPLRVSGGARTEHLVGFLQLVAGGEGLRQHRLRAHRIGLRGGQMLRQRFAARPDIAACPGEGGEQQQHGTQHDRSRRCMRQPAGGRMNQKNGDHDRPRRGEIIAMLPDHFQRYHSRFDQMCREVPGESQAYDGVDGARCRDHHNEGGQRRDRGERDQAG